MDLTIYNRCKLMTQIQKTFQYLILFKDMDRLKIFLEILNLNNGLSLLTHNTYLSFLVPINVGNEFENILFQLFMVIMNIYNSNQQELNIYKAQILSYTNIIWDTVDNMELRVSLTEETIILLAEDQYFDKNLLTLLIHTYELFNFYPNDQEYLDFILCILCECRKDWWFNSSRFDT
eukprot:280787_1